jgi:hypothetical protein
LDRPYVTDIVQQSHTASTPRNAVSRAPTTLQLVPKHLLTATLHTK